MKKVVKLLLLLGMFSLLAGCSAPDNGGGSVTTPAIKEPGEITEAPGNPDHGAEEGSGEATTPKPTAGAEENTTPVPTGCVKHEYGEWVVLSEATCTTEGKQERKCKHCEAVQSEVIGILDHSLEKVPGYEATCTEKGLTDGMKCTVCGLVTEEQKDIAALKHKYGEWEVTKQPTCETQGTRQKKCTRCNDTKRETLDYADHKLIVVKGYEATCDSDGLTDGQMCSVCGMVPYGSEQSRIRKLTHKYGEWVVVQEATCGEDGITKRKCSLCGNEESDTIPATEKHTYSNGKCVNCGEDVKGSSFLTYRLSSDGTYYVCTGTNSYGLKSEIIIPSYYNGKPVKEVGIGNPSFCSAKKIVIMEGIEKINAEAFYADLDVKEVYLPSTIKYIGYWAFSYCSNLEYVSIPGGNWVEYARTSNRRGDVMDFSNPYMAAEILREGDYSNYVRE